MQGRSQRPLERATSLQRLGFWQLRLAAVGQKRSVDIGSAIADNRATSTSDFITFPFLFR